tara:strand:+ start:325 stop:570 length:246 start_codon:yes stop_codon:yes gene_type:complete
VCRLAAAACGDPDSRRRALVQHCASETEEFRRASRARAILLSCAFDQAVVGYKAAKVLLVEADSREAFRDLLKLQQGEIFR